MTRDRGQQRERNRQTAWRATSLRRWVARLSVAWGLLAVIQGTLWAQTGWAQDIGAVVEVEGTAEISRAGATTPAAIGASIAQGDVLRTSRPGRLVVVFQDNSVLTAGDDSELTVDSQVFDRDAGLARSVLRLLRGRIRTLVSEYYDRPGTEFRVETPTAVVGVRGTEFVIVFDPVAEVTDAVGVSGRAEVHSVIDEVGHGVFITAREITTVRRGQYPTSPPRRLDDEEFREYLEGLEFVGHGKPESLAAVQPLLTGSGVPAPDRLANLPAPPIPVAQGTGIGPAPAVPGETARDVFDTHNAGGVTTQSPSVIDATDGLTQGQVGYHF